MKTTKFLIFCVLLGVFVCVMSKRISESKCNELATLNTDPRSLHPHLMELVYNDSGDTFCLAILISEHFVLTSAECADANNFRVRKLKLPAEQYSDATPFFNVKQILSDKLADPQADKHNFGLIELKETVPYRYTRSIYRPACLWTETVEPTNLYAWNDFEKMMVNSLITTGSSELCSQSYVCISSRDELPLVNMPIELKHRNETYIFGIISYFSIDGYYLTYYAGKINSFIEWIEPKVWPVHQLLNRDCGQRILKHKPLMTFAQPTYHGEYPWHVAIYRNNVYSCGGTILNRRTILTAAHCVQDELGVISTDILKIVAGTYNLVQSPAEARNFFVQSIIVHDGYSRTYLENDIALLKLSDTIVFTEYIQPICISNTLDYTNFTLGTVAGWGRDEYNRPSNVLLQATLPVRDNFECRESNRDFFPQYLNDNNFCAGYQNGTNICSGDSGGSMIVEFESRWFIRGIVSLGVALTNTNRCDITQLVLFTDVPKMYDWIQKHVDGNE